MKVIASYETFFLLCLTFLIVNDYFPETLLIHVVPLKTLRWLIIVVFILSVLFSRKKTHNKSSSLKWQIFILAYSLALIALLMALGGKSASGVSFNNIYFWIVLAISVFELIFQYKRVKRSR
jgi:predicted CDP-diglyceride synthetase/phosphatidate cytidylyltransferase